MCAVIGAICFLISGFGIFYRFGFAVPILESSELVRIFTYGFARIGGALIPFSMAATGALAIRKKRKKLELEHAHICKEYQEFYPKFLKQHRNKYLFFALCETVHELQKDYPNFDFLREQFSIIYTKIGRLYHVHAGNQTEILTLLKQELRDPRFIFLIDEIKRFIKIKINLLERLRNINVENFIKQLDEDDYIDNFIFEIVGELSARKIRPSSSEFLTIVPLLEKEVSIPIRSILTRYWNDSPQRDQLIHPRDANLAEIAATTITKLFEKYPLLVCGYILTPPIPSQHFLGRQLMPEDQWTLSQSLHHAFWDQRLLSPEQFDRKLSDNLKDSLAIYNIANYVCNIIAAICFLISGFGIFYRFGFAVPTLHQSELVRIFTYSFARIGGAILPLSMATTGWLALRMKGIKLRQEHDYLCKEYREFYPKFLNQHTRKYLFFVFCEIIYELRQLRPNFNFLRLQLSIVYFPSAIVLNIRGIIFGATTDEKDIETARTLTDSLGYFWVPGVITVATAVTGILQYLNNRKQNRRSFSFLMKDYKDNRRVFINNHNLTGAFFAITEIIQRLRFLANTDPLYYIKLEQIEKDLNKIAQKISHDFKIIFEKNINNLIISSPLNIIEQLQRLLASTKFNYVTNNIKKELILNSIVLKMSHKLRSDYQQKINNDFILHKIIIDIIAELSSVKSRIGTSPYLQSIKLIEESTLGGIRQALIKYWHQPEIKKKIVHSYDVNFSALAMEINNMMREVAPDQILQETRPIRRLPPHLSTVVATPWRPVRVTASVRVLSSPIGGASQPIGSPPGACYIPSPVRPQHSR